MATEQPYAVFASREVRHRLAEALIEPAVAAERERLAAEIETLGCRFEKGLQTDGPLWCEWQPILGVWDHARDCPKRIAATIRAGLPLR